ncbi:hypothetical protein K504DRAFT_468487 [Pleomassaria siparia CBS 279.74]|uniref:F-box domain-containing protein n=1 Tax=Pleomassaria siparia CBS 279.74 TaxID=1314801 RepID=A0A6G1K6V6_9PLEO|nr:hypothetical protein K504DRAFT_468487 [Pleomassaria siparia CBS 279.74]
MQDLLLAQRVCHRWKAIIRKSEPIQRALYFLAEIPPQPTTSFYPNTPCFKYGSLIKANALLNKAFSDCMIINGVAHKYSGPSGICNCPEFNDKRTAYGCILGVWVKSFPRGKGFEDRHRYQEASWRRMFLTQPPVRRLRVNDWRIAPDYDDCFKEDVVNEDGVRMSDLLELEELYSDEAEETMDNGTRQRMSRAR